MDLSFPRLDSFRNGVSKAPLTYAELVASVAAVQAGTRTAEVETRLAAARPPLECPVEALMAVLKGNMGQAAIAPAISLLGGSFHPARVRKSGGNPP